MRNRQIQLLLSISFLLVFSIKQAAMVLPSLLGQVGVELAVVVEAEEQEEKAEKEKTEKEKKGCEEKFDITNDHSTFFAVQRTVVISGNTVQDVIYHPNVPTPPPDQA